MALAITATMASPGPSSGRGTSPTCSDLRGSLSRLSRPSNMSTSSLRTVAARTRLLRVFGRTAPVAGSGLHCAGSAVVSVVPDPGHRAPGGRQDCGGKSELHQVADDEGRDTQVDRGDNCLLY